MCRACYFCFINSFPHVVKRHNYHRRIYEHLYNFPSLRTEPLACGHRNTAGTNGTLRHMGDVMHIELYAYVSTRIMTFFPNNDYMLYRLIKRAIEVLKYKIYRFHTCKLWVLMIPTHVLTNILSKYTFLIKRMVVTRDAR